MPPSPTRPPAAAPMPANSLESTWTYSLPDSNGAAGSPAIDSAPTSQLPLRTPFVTQPSSQTLGAFSIGGNYPADGTTTYVNGAANGLSTENSSTNLLSGYPTEALAAPALANGDVPKETATANGDAINGDVTMAATFNPEKQTVTGGGKLMYLEGLRGIAAFFVANGHFVDAMFRDQQPQVANFRPFNLLWGGGWSVTLFFVLSGRVITASFIRSLASSKPKFAALASAIFRRPFRLGIPCAAAALIQWLVAITGATQAANEAGKILNSPDMKTPGWSLIQNFGEYVIFVFNLFTYGDPDYVLLRGSTLWTIPFEYWGSNFIYLLTFTIFLLPTRHWMVYPVIIAMNWWTYNYNFMFAIGLLLADLDFHGIWATIKSWKWYYVVALEIALLAVAGVVLWVPVVSNTLDYGVLPHQLYHGTMGAEASWHGISTSLWISATLVLIWAEITTIGEWVLETWPFAFLGKISFGLYLIHTTVLFTIVPRLVIDFSAIGMSYWGMIAACYAIYIVICFIFGWIFHLFIDEPSILIGKWLWDGVTNEWPTSWAGWQAGFKNTMKDIWAFYKRMAWTMITCGCADSKRKRKAAAKGKDKVEPVEVVNGELAEPVLTNGEAPNGDLTKGEVVVDEAKSSPVIGVESPVKETFPKDDGGAEWTELVNVKKGN